MADVVKVFLRKYNIDERAARNLEACTPDVQLKVLSTFDPRGQPDEDYSRKLMAYIRSITSGGPVDSSVLRKRGRGAETEDLASHRASKERWRDGDREEEEDENGVADELLGNNGVPDRDNGGGAGEEPDDTSDLLEFKAKFPMDDRAYDFLCSSPAAARKRVLRDFNPRSSNDADYSSLVTSVVRKVRLELEADSARGASAVLRGRSSGAGVQRGFGGPSASELEEFRLRFPMDARAWEFLTSCPGATQARVVAEFRPRSLGDSDYSAAITSFLRILSTGRGSAPSGGGGAASSAFGGGGHPASSSSRARGARAPSRRQLEDFRDQFPMDERAFEFLSTSSTAVQLDVLQNFSPRNMQDNDYSRPVTAYVKQARDRFGRELDTTPRGGGGLLTGRRGRSAASRSRSPKRGHAARSGVDGSCPWLRAFRTCYPMDERAFDFLEQCAPEVQEAVVAEFRPRHAGEDDYSAPITAFVRKVRSRLEAGPPGVRLVGRRTDVAPRSLLDAFRERYPMDERAWDYLVSASVSLQKAVLERFRPQREGERDYSRLITSFIRTTKS